MDTDIKMEIIYFCQGSDIKLEFGLRGEYPLRLLTSSCNDYRSFLSSLKKAVARSEVIITVGGFFGDKYLPDILGRAIGNKCKETDLSIYGLNNVHQSLTLPDGAVPLISCNGEFGGCVIESGPQSIIMLTEDNKVRLSLLFELVVPYVTEHYQFNHGIKEYVPSPITNDSEKGDPKLPIQNLNCSNVIQPILNNNDTSSNEENIGELDVLNTPIPLTEEIASVNNIEKNITDSADSDLLLNMAETTDETNDIEETNTSDFPDETSDIKESQKQPESNNLNQLIKDIEFLTDEDVNSKKARSKMLHIIITCVLAVLLLVVIGYFAYLKIYLPKHTSSFYNRIHSLYLDNSVTLGSENFTSEFLKLTNIDSNTCGWVKAPGTNINYPVVSLSEEKDESYYKAHLLDGTFSTYGTPYLLGDLSGETFYRNYVIFGNSTEDFAMFSNLSLYLNEEFCTTATTIQFDSIIDKGNWQIFSTFSFSGETPFDLIQTDFASDVEYFSYINSLIENSSVAMNTEISARNPIIVLICESNDSTVVVAAKLLPTITSQSILVNAATASAESNTSVDITSSVDASSAESSKAAPSSTTKVTSSAAKITSSVTKAVSTKFEQPAPAKPAVTSIPDNIVLTVRSSYNGAIVTGNSQDILAMIIEAEMNSTYPLEALKAQTVAAYSWLLTNGAASGSAPTVPIMTAQSRAKEAVNAVLGKKVMYGGTVAQTFYYAISAGLTANSQDIWSTKLPYLQSVDSSVDSSISEFSTTRVYKAIDVALWIQAQYNLDILNISKSLWFVPEYDQNGLYCTYITIGKQMRVKGTELRNCLFTTNRVGSENVLRSSAYQISYDSASDSFTFTVKGYGHGVGMSQVGAKAYANQGWTYTQILQHYYSGISIE
ncbi:MAG: SpoIID/LytB domain-containing protein [Oscillospiraceae bacterium]|nr:SpoIID/LytB domain-containing protein [Oscillospiraceae bacterium]